MQEEERGTGACVPCDRRKGCDSSAKRRSFGDARAFPESEAAEFTRLAKAAMDDRAVPGTLWGDPYPLRGPHCAVGMYMAGYSFSTLCYIHCKPLYRRGDKTAPYMQFPGLFLVEKEKENDYNTFPDLVQTDAFRCGEGSFTWPSLSACFPALQGFGVLATQRFDSSSEMPALAYYRRMFEYGYTDCYAGWNNTYPGDSSNECKAFSQYLGIVQLVGTWSQPFDYACAEGSISRKDFFSSPRCYPVPMNRAAAGATNPTVTGALVCTADGLFRPPGMKGKDCLSFVGGAYAASTGTHMYLRDLPGQPFHRGASAKAPARLCDTYQIECSPHGDFPALDFYVNLFPKAPTAAAAGFFQPHGVDRDTAAQPPCPYGFKCALAQMQASHPRLPSPFSLSASGVIRSRRGMSGREPGSRSKQSCRGGRGPGETGHTCLSVFRLSPSTGAFSCLYTRLSPAMRFTPTFLREGGGGFHPVRFHFVRLHLVRFHLELPLGAGVNLGNADTLTDVWIYMPGANAPEYCCHGCQCSTTGDSVRLSAVPAGSFRGRRMASGDMGTYHLCSPGHACPPAAVFETPCRAGTYQGASGRDACSPVAPGAAGTGLGAVRPVPCPPGHFCLQETPTPFANPCPEGTFSEQAGGNSKGTCLPCPAGHTCAKGTGGRARPGLCPVGHYCDSGKRPVPCPAGTHAPYAVPSPHMTDVTKCVPCPESVDCPKGSSLHTLQINGVCPAGAYCPGGNAAKAQKCPIGMYGVEPGAVEPADCLYCPAGRFCEVTPPGDADFPVTAEPCPPNSFSINTGVAGNSSRIFASEWEREAGVQMVFTTNGGGLCRTETADFSRFTNVRQEDGRGLPSDALASLVEGDNLFWIVTKEGQGFVSVDNLYSFNVFNLPRDATLLGFANRRLWAGHASSGGLLVSRDRGWSFTRVSAASVASAKVLAGDPLSGYLCVGDASRVHCSRDNFETVAETSAVGDAVHALLVLQDDVVLAAAGPSLFQSRDGGRRFRRVSAVGDVVRLVRHGADVYAAWTGGVLKSTDRGAAFAAWATVPAAALPIADFGLLGGVFVLRSRGGALWTSTTGQDWAETQRPADSPCGQFPITSAFFADYKLPRAVEGTSGQCIAGNLSQAKEAITSKPGEMIVGGKVEPCKAGYYCPSTCDEANQVVLPCPAGTWCASGVDRQPSFGSHPCPRGHYCPKATPDPVKCPAGTYNPQLHQETVDACRPSPAGFSIAELGAAEPSQQCPPGRYCPEGTKDGGAVCPPGTSRRLPGGADVSDCFPCPAGYFCPNDLSQGNSLEPQPCPTGHYCPQGAAAATKCPPGTMNLSERVTSMQECDLCPRGSYCTGTSALSVTGECDAGFLCISGATNPRPTDGVTGSPCPAGGYCPAGALIVQPCSAGKYNPTEGAASEDACEVCPPGSYCLGSGSSSPDGKCSPGHFCPQGSSRATENKAAKGYFAEAGASKQTPCARGSFAPDPGMHQCLACPAGTYCPSEGMHAPLQCPQGSYCLEGVPVALGCAAGTYGDRAGLRDWDECKMCPPGSFCGSEGLSQPSGQCRAGYFCVHAATSATPEVVSTGKSLVGEVSGPCPAGSFCPEGSVTPTPCPKGTFSPAAKAESDATCQQCTAGFYCDRPGISAPTGPCPEGYFCPVGTAVARAPGRLCLKGFFCPEQASAARPCPPGTFAELAGAAACAPCPGGFLCAEQAEEFSATCVAGHYCPTGVNAAVECPAGTVGSGTQGPHVSACLECPPGSYCEASGLAAPTNACPEGTYCPGGVVSESDATACPEGFYCPAGSAVPFACKQGQYCEGPSLAQPTGGCKPATYCPVGTTAAAGVACPRGSYCPGDTDPLPCPPGTYGDAESLSAEDQCTPCPAGSYCSSPGLVEPSGLCAGGYFCAEGTADARPANGLCPPGHKCPPGAEGPQACPINAWQPLHGQTECQPCPAGFLCENHGARPCDEGSYCDGVDGTKKDCPVGTYQPLPGQTSEASCLPCKPGYVCDTSPLERPTKKCPGGSYCGGASQKKCPAGFYCPEGTERPFACSPGHYCEGDGLERPTGRCAAGHYCARGATERRPTGALDIEYCFTALTSGDCPAGYYCPEGVAFPVRCPPGTFSNAPGRGALSDCQSCTAGSYCGGFALTAVTGPCLAGFYCPGGQRTPYELPCPKGSMCPAGSADATECPEGQYQPAEGKSKCLPCIEGFRCPRGSYEVQSCAAGHFCADGVTVKCPVGTHSASTGIWKSSQCRPCPPGKVCSADGAANADAATDCPAGHYCRLGASTTPAQDPTTCGRDPTSCLPGAKCPAGYYCPAGSAGPIPCPQGTTGSPEGSTSKTQCMKCPAGRYCSGGGASGECDAGFFCVAGSTAARPRNGLCPVGKYCARGSAAGTDCSPGTYADVEGLAECRQCPAGFVCSGTGLASGTGEPCPAGHFCVEGTHTPAKCPVGTFSASTHATDASWCQLCPPGHFCDTEGLRAPAGDCQAGYFCLQGASQADPPTPDPPGANGECPVGFYCPARSSAPKACPPGTFSATPKATRAEDCQECPEGQFCGVYALPAPEGICDDGFFCGAGQISRRPLGTGTAGLCPAGHACSGGAKAPCPEHSYMDEQGAALCKSCPAGHFCEAQARAPHRCPATFFCETGKGKKTCPDGTYSDATGLAASSDCLECPTTKFCAHGKIQASCSAGFICVLGVGPTGAPAGASSDGAPPHHAVQLGEPCPRGAYCPAGTDAPLRCPPGTTTASTGAASVADCVGCKAGFYCATVNTAATACPRGYYCPAESREPRPCPEGTYNPNAYAESVASCMQCDAGFLCPEGSDKQRTACPLGFYCEGGSAPKVACPEGTYGKTTGTSKEEDACGTCPAGYYCPGADHPYEPCPAGKFCTSNSPAPLACTPGFYCPGATSAPVVCPLGFYCPPETALPLECPDGSLCPRGAAQPQACPAGTRSRGPQACAAIPTVDGCCEACPAGTFSSGAGSVECQPCAAGFVCTGGAATPEPTDRVHGYICPRGAFCPAGALAPVPCPAGRFNAEEGAEDAQTGCLPCPAGTFSDALGATACSTCGGTSTSLEGQQTCECVGVGRTFQKEDGTCVCRNFYEFYSSTRLAPGDESADSALDCQPVAQPRCESASSAKNPRLARDAGSRLLRAADGACVAPETICETQCGDVGGIFLAHVGMCQCLSVRDAGQKPCDRACRSRVATLVLEGDAFACKLPASEATQKKSVQSLIDNSLLKGSVACGSDMETLDGQPHVCRTSFYLLNSTGVFGTVGVPAGFQKLLATDPQGSASEGTSDSRAGVAHADAAAPNDAAGPKARCPAPAPGASPLVDRRRNACAAETLPASSELETELYGQDSSNEMAVIRNPTQCLQKGDTIIWMIAGAFPVYLRNSLLNTAAGFDASPYLNVQGDLAYEGTDAKPPVTYFAFSFTVPGQYVFATNVSDAHQAIFRVLDEGVSCDEDARFPLPTEFSSLAAAGVQMRADVLLEPELATVELLFLGALGILWAFVLIVSWLRKQRFQKEQATGVSENRRARSPAHAFGVHAVAHQTRTEIENLLSHVIESGKDVDALARVTRLSPEELEGFLAAYQAPGEASNAPTNPVDLRRFEAAYTQLARAHVTLGKYFRQRKWDAAQLGVEQLKTLDGLQNFVAPIIRKVDWKLDESSALQKTILAMTKACERLVDELRAPHAFFGAGSLDESSAASPRLERFSLPAVSSSLEKGGKKAVLLTLAEEVSTVVCMTRGESQALPVLAQYLDVLREGLDDQDATPFASSALSSFVQSSAGSLEGALEKVLQHQERGMGLEDQLAHRPFADAVGRARVSDRCERELVTRLLDAVEDLLASAVQQLTAPDEPRGTQRVSCVREREGGDGRDSAERVLAGAERPGEDEGAPEEAGNGGGEKKREKKTRLVPGAGGGSARTSADPVAALQDAIQTLCNRHFDELSRTLSAHQQAYSAALDKRESAKMHQTEERQNIEKLLLSQFLQFFKATETQRIAQFYERLETSRISKLREGLREELYELERSRRREDWAPSDFEEKKKKALQRFEARVKAGTEELKRDKDSLLVATLDAIDSQQEKRNAALEALHAAEIALVKAKAANARELADKIFEQQEERVQKDLEGRRARFLLVAQNIGRLHDRIVGGEVVPTAHLADSIEDASGALEDLRRGQDNERRAWLSAQRDTRDAILKRRKEAIQAKATDLKSVTRQYTVQETGLYAELFSQEEDALLPYGARATAERVDAVFATQLRQHQKAYRAVFEEADDFPLAAGGSAGEASEAVQKAKAHRLRLEEADRQRFDLKEEEKEKQIQAIEARLAEIRDNRNEALRCIADLEVEVTERYLIKASDGSGRLMEDEAFEDSATIAAEAKRLSQLQKNILEFAKKQLVAARNAGKPRGKNSHLPPLGGWAKEAKRLLQIADEDRQEIRADYEKKLKQRSRAENSAASTAPSPTAWGSEDTDKIVNALLLKIREKRQEVRNSLFFLDDIVDVICDAKLSTSESVQIDALYDRATREVEEEFEREMKQLQEEFESDARRLEAELAEERSRIGRTEEMERSRLEVERRLKKATATSDEEIEAVRRDFDERIDRVQREFESEREAQERAFQEKLARRRELFNRRKQKLAEKAQAEEARVQEDRRRKKTVAERQRSEATFECLLDEARSHPTSDTIEQLHKFMAAQLSEAVNATVLQQLSEKSSRLTAVAAEMRSKHADERSATEAKLDRQIAAAEKMASASDASSPHLLEEIEDLKRMKEEKLRELDATFKLKVDSALQIERLAIEPVQAERVFALQQEHLKNIVKVLSEFVALGEETAVGLTQQAKQAQTRIELERARMKEIAGMKVLDLDKILKEKEAELKKQMEANIAALREKLKAQQEREEQLQREAHEAEMKKRKEEQRARQLKQLRRMINCAKADDPEAADDIFKKYQDDAERLEAALAKERARQHMILQSQLHQKVNRKELQLRQEGEGQMSEERARLKKTRDLAAVTQETGDAATDAEELDEQEMWKYFFTVRVAEEVAKKAKRIQELLRAALRQLTSGPPKEEGEEVKAFATPESIENLLDKLSRLTEALVVPEDDEDEE
uniref:GCC2 and GCC3 domain-containing protein n=1 Tax=Neospora caninum (strain Liverpool) TaxID=572307 RepID=A0A0F7U6P9_NEOCL|nr:TPA: GCC2 and GCC3 domain-containing protein [Neospora caninum Liverpool]